MKKISVAACLLALAVIMLLPIASQVNSVLTPHTLAAQGFPIPPPPPGGPGH